MTIRCPNHRDVTDHATLDEFAACYARPIRQEPIARLEASLASAEHELAKLPKSTPSDLRAVYELEVAKLRIRLSAARAYAARFPSPKPDPNGPAPAASSAPSRERAALRSARKSERPPSEQTVPRTDVLAAPPPDDLAAHRVRVNKAREARLAVRPGPVAQALVAWSRFRIRHLTRYRELLGRPPL